MTPHDLITRPGGYRLTDGVTATVAGLLVTDADVSDDIAAILETWSSIGHPRPIDITQYLILWPDAAERLRTREDEPYCFVVSHYEGEDSIICDTAPGPTPIGYSLYRLAAILCDDAEAFNVLHWCVHNLGGES